MATRHNKAIRDRIPEIIRSSGRDCNVVTLSDSEFLARLEEKLFEELTEYTESGSPEELADIMEVIYRISELRGVTKMELEEIRKRKCDDRGGFQDNLFLIDATQGVPE